MSSEEQRINNRGIKPVTERFILNKETINWIYKHLYQSKYLQIKVISFDELSLLDCKKKI